MNLIVWCCFLPTFTRSYRIPAATHYEDSSSFVEALYGDKYVDKSMLIAEFEDYSGESIIVSRPKGWGKSTNLDMLKKFYEIEMDAKKHERLTIDQRINGVLFVGGGTFTYGNRTQTMKPLLVSEHPAIMRQHGQHPVVYLDFSRVSGRNYSELEDGLRRTVVSLFGRHRYLDARIRKEPSKPTKQMYERCKSGDNDEASLGVCLQMLVWRMADQFDKPVYVFVDGYDGPLNDLLTYLLPSEEIRNNNSIATSDDDFKQAVKLYGRFYGCALKANPFVRKSLLTSVLPVANSVLKLHKDRYDIYTLLDARFKSYYGFSRSELKENNDNVNRLKIRCGGYDNDIFKPACVIERLLNINKTMSSRLGEDDVNAKFIDRLLRSNNRLQLKMLDILTNNGKPIVTNDLKHFTYENLADNDNKLVAFLLHAGYVVIATDEGTLKIPNEETEEIYHDTINRWRRYRFPHYEDKYLREKMLSVVDGKFDQFRVFLNEFYYINHDDDDDDKEKLDYGRTLFVLCLTLANDYSVRTESSLDIIILTEKRSSEITSRRKTAVIFRIGTVIDDKAEEAAKLMNDIDVSRCKFFNTSDDRIEKVVTVGLAFSSKAVTLAGNIVDRVADDRN